VGTKKTVSKYNTVRINQLFPISLKMERRYESLSYRLMKYSETAHSCSGTFHAGGKKEEGCLLTSSSAISPRPELHLPSLCESFLNRKTRGLLKLSILNHRMVVWHRLSKSPPSSLTTHSSSHFPNFEIFLQHPFTHSNCNYQIIIKEQ
jgi:hypothetical protein